MAGFYKDRLNTCRLASNRAKFKTALVHIFGQDYVDQLDLPSKTSLSKTTERYLAAAVRDFADVEFRNGITIGEEAKSGLFEIQNLLVGKRAPIIAGVDQDGVKFKSSDYQGKVVLVYFWNEY